MTTVRRLRSRGTALLLLAASLGCPSGDTSGPGPVAVDRVTVSPAALDLLVGAQQGLSATALAADGTPIPGKAAAWSSNNTTAATVNATTGLVTAVGAGSAVITAVIDGRTGQATVQVTLPPQPLAVVTAGTGTGTVTASPDGITCTRASGASSGTCSTTYPADTPVTLQAVAAEGGHAFMGWSGEGCAGTGPCQLVMSQARTITATFAAPHQLTVITAGGGNGSVSSTPAGIGCSRAGGVQSGTCTLALAEGSIFTLTATPAAGHAFAGWTGGGCSGTAPCQVTMTEARTVTATFIETPTLTVVMGGTGSGMVISAPVGIACGSVNGAPSGACSAPFPAGAAVTLTAQGTAGSTFAGWTGEGCSGTTPCQVMMSQARMVTATFTVTYLLDVQLTGAGQGSVTSVPAGIDCMRAAGVTTGTCSVLFPDDALVTLTPSPAGGNLFLGWSGEGCAGTTACQLLMDRPRAVSAGFGASLDLVVSVTGDGAGTVTSAPAGISCSLAGGGQAGQCLLTAPSGTTVTLLAQPAPGHDFLTWSGESCQGTGSCQVTLTVPSAVAATFVVRKATLTVNTSGPGSGTVTSDPGGILCQRAAGSEAGTCEAEYPLGSAVTLQALAPSGYLFTGWSGGGCTGSGACQVVMGQDRQVTATFAVDTRSLTVVTAGTGPGTVTSTPVGIACSYNGSAQSGSCVGGYPTGAPVTLVAQPSPNGLFLGWTGGGCTGTGNCAVTLAQHTQVTATFGLPKQLLTVTPSGIGNGAVTSTPAGINCTRSAQAESGTCSAAFDAGTVVSLTATPTGAHAFTGWSGAGCTGTTGCQVTLDQAVTVTADFTIPLGIGFGPEQWADLPAGTYVRGSANGTTDNQPPHTVILTQPIRMLRTEITWAQYSEAAFGTDPATLAPGFRLQPWDGGDPASVQYNFLDALNLRYPGRGFRLPTEGEWEYAARAGSAADAPANLSAVAWFGEPPVGSGHPVAQKQPNAWGLYDMLGNLWELVQDNWGPYPSGTVTDPVGSPTPGSHVIRGGAFHLPAGSVNHFIRQSYAYVGFGADLVGFRIVSAGGGQYQLTLVLTGSGSGTVSSFGQEVNCRFVAGVQSGDCTHIASAGSTLSLVVTSGSQSTFMGWSGGGCSGTGGCVVTFNQAQAVTARFDSPFSVSVTGTGNGSGTVTSLPEGVACTIVPGGGVTGSCQAPFPAGTLVTLTAAPSTSGPYAFSGWSGDCTGPGNCTVVVSQPRTVTAAFAYSPGALAVTISGLPGGTTAAVSASGPGGVTLPVPGTMTVTDLAPGSWTVTAAPVTSGGITFLPTPTTQTVQVSLGTTTPVSVMYAPGPPPTLNLRIAGAYLTQGIQNISHAAELLAGRDAYLRVFVVANQANTATPRVRVKAWQGNTEVWNSFISANTGSVTQNVAEGNYASSWNIRVPGNLIQPGFRFLAEVDPDATVPEADEGDNMWPGPGQVFAVAVRALPRFEITLVPVFQTATGLTGNVTISNVETYLTDLRRMLPVDNLTLSWEVTGPYTSARRALSANDVSTWSDVLSDINALRVMNGSSRYYYGVVKVNYGSGLAGVAYRPSQPPSARAAIGWDYGNSRANVLSHEIGHNLGRGHAPCGTSGSLDPSYPFATGSIGNWGMETEGLSYLGGNPFLTQLKDPFYYRDVMGYCPSYPWISIYNWNLMMAWRAASPGGAPPAAFAASGPDDGLLVWGQISSSGIRIEPAFRTTPTAQPLPTTGAWRVEGRDAAGAILFAQRFEPEEVADIPGPPTYHYAMVLPVGATRLDRLASLRVVGPGQSAERRASGVPPQFSIEPEARLAAGNRRRLTWDAQWHPAALIRDAVTGRILSIAHGGEVNLVTTAQALDIQLSNGVQVTRRRVPVR